MFGESFISAIPKLYFAEDVYDGLKGLASRPTSSRIFLPGDSIPYSAGQCTAWVKWHTDLDISGNAIAWADYATKRAPRLGDVIVLRMSRWGHVGIVMSFNNNTLTYRSRNQEGLWVISDTTIDINDSRILGFISN